ncbi:MAG: hypothetical protein K2Y21_12540 [Phycisphaerales bacterium]|nr:hypothetical protein [Phycisphaerales bacterium]
MFTEWLWTSEAGESKRSERGTPSGGCAALCDAEVANPNLIAANAILRWPVYSPILCVIKPFSGSAKAKCRSAELIWQGTNKDAPSPPATLKDCFGRPLISSSSAEKIGDDMIRFMQRK